MAHPYDSRILARIGLDDFAAIDFFQKQESFIASLSEKQHTIVKKAFPSWKDAAKAIHPKMEADDLKDFVARRSPLLAAYPVVAIITPPPDEGEEGGESPDLPTPTTPPTPPPPANPDPSDGK